MIYFLVFHGQPKKDVNNSDNVGGAYITCYIQADNKDIAEQISKKDIENMKWDILDCEETYEIDSDNVSAESRDYYEQAQIDRTVYVFHTYPIDENEK